MRALTLCAAVAALSVVHVTAVLPTLHLGICGYNEDVNNPPPWPGVWAIARKTFESGNPIIALPGTSQFNVNWYYVYGDTSTESVEEGMRRILGNRVEGVTHEPSQIIIGCEGSGSSAKVAPVGALMGVPLISWWAGSPDLSNKDSFPYFLRTRGTSTGNGAGVVYLANNFGWVSIGFLYEDQSFHIGVYEGAVAAAQELSISIEPFRLFYFPDEITQSVWDAKMAEAAATDLRVFGMSVMGPVSKNRAALEAAQTAGLNEKGLLIAALELADFYPSHSEELRLAFNGMLGVDYSQTGSNAISAAFEEAWSAMSFTEMASWGVPQEYIDSIETNIPDVFSNSPFIQFQAYMLDAIYAALIAYQKLLDGGIDPNRTSFGQDFLDALYNVSFTGATGTVSFTKIVDSVGGDREVLAFQVFNTQNGEVVVVGAAYGTTVVLDQAVVFPDGGSDPREYDVTVSCESTEVRLRDETSGTISCSGCDAGEGPNDDQSACESCQVGYFSPTSDSKCSACPEGAYQEQSGQSRCTDCLAGTYSNSTGASACQACLAGTIAASAASVSCTACQPGTSQGSIGQSACNRCAFGEYQASSGQTDCLQCSGGRTTAGQGSTSNLECLCDDGYYSKSDTSVCEVCPEGMVCDIGASLSNFDADTSDKSAYLSADLITYPKLLPGYYSSRDDPLSVYYCIAEENCPGGDPGSCSGNRGSDGGFLCLDCKEGEYLGEKGCEECEWYHVATPIVLALAAFVALLVVARVSAVKLTSQRPHLLILFMVLGQLITFLQVSVAFNAMQLRWGGPFSSILESLSFVSLNVEVMNTSCLSVSIGAQSYILQMVSPIIIVLAVAFVFAGAQRARPGLLNLDSFFNSVGQLAQMVYITFTLVALVPFHCYKHPNGKDSIVTYPRILCGDPDGDYYTVLSTGLLGLLVYPLLTICIVFWAIFKYPQVILSSDVSFLWRFRSIFFRWRSECYWYTGVLLVRNFLLSVFPMTISESNVEVSALLMHTVLLTCFLIGALNLPWKTAAMNRLDLALNFCLLIVLFTGSMTAGGNDLSRALSSLLVVLVLFSLIVSLLVALWRVSLVLVKLQRYHIFISHHKGAGACLARLLKHTLEKELQRRIFYDCDDLSNLGEIFDAVKQSENLLVILSGETLCRPWCIGEIVTAHHCNVHMVPLRVGCASAVADETDKFVSLTGTEKQAIFAGFDVLRPFGVLPEHVEPAVEHLLKRPALSLGNHCSTAELRDMVIKVAGEFHTKGLLEPMVDPVAWCGRRFRAKPKKRDSLRVSKVASGAGTVLIMTEPGNTDAAAAGHFIRMILQESLQDDIGMDVDIDDEHLTEALHNGGLRAIVWIVMASTFSSANQLARLTIVYSNRPQAQVLPVVIGDGVTFPSKSFVDGLEAEELELSLELSKQLDSKGLSSQQTAVAVTRVFNSIATFVNIQQAEKTVLHAQIQRLADRVKAAWDVPLKRQSTRDMSFESMAIQEI